MTTTRTGSGCTSRTMSTSRLNTAYTNTWNGILLDQVTHSNVTGNNASYNGLSGINLTLRTTTRRTAYS